MPIPGATRFNGWSRTFRGDLETREEWINHAALLDKYYIPTRYPNGLPDLTPGEVYREDDSTRGLTSAQTLISGVTRRFQTKP